MTNRFRGGRAMKKMRIGLRRLFLVAVFLYLSEEIFAQSYNYSYSSSPFSYYRYGYSGYYPGYYSTFYPSYYYSGYYLTPYQYTQLYYPFHLYWRKRKEQLIQQYSKEGLLEQIKSASPAKRCQASQLLTRFTPDEEIKKALEAVLEDPIPAVRESVIKSLLSYENNSRLKEVIGKLGEVPFANSEQNVSILGKVLGSARDPLVRARAAQSLGKLTNPRALSFLELAKQRDVDTVVQEEIDKAIRKIQEKKEQ